VDPPASGAHTDPTMAKKQANGASHQLDSAVHSLEKKMEEQAELLARNPQEQKEAGLGQLVVCVGGIYASL
jgi:UDP-galactose transporter B1